MSDENFKAGRLLVTASVKAEISPSDLFAIMHRHLGCDWGDVCDEDRKANDDALDSGDRILSVYHVNGVKLYVITESDRSTTTILKAEEY